MKATGGVDEHQIGAHRFGAFQGVEAHRGRIASALARHHLHAGALRPHLQLLDGGRSEGIGAAEQHLAARIRRLLRQLADGGGLAGAVDAHEQHHGPLAAQDILAT